MSSIIPNIVVLTIQTYETIGRFGKKKEGYQEGNLVAGYTHFHFVSNPKLVDNWLTACKKVKSND